MLWRSINISNGGSSVAGESSLKNGEEMTAASMASVINESISGVVISSSAYISKI